MTDPIDFLENVVHASFISAVEMRCATPSRPAGTYVGLYASIAGLGNFSEVPAFLTYYDEQRPLVRRRLAGSGRGGFEGGGGRLWSHGI